MFLVTVSFLLAIIIPSATVMLKINTTLNKLTFLLDMVLKRLDDHDIRLDAQDDDIRNIQINCAKQGHTPNRHP